MQLVIEIEMLDIQAQNTIMLAGIAPKDFFRLAVKPSIQEQPGKGMRFILHLQAGFQATNLLPQGLKLLFRIQAYASTIFFFIHNTFSPTR
ncbi:hypothetical protein SDC9_120452 [bioreactor metagenome]|uniref:Uncharacterized protein n=1 Tax=bioreactor metagenome TaxID=1076179 RepID=A0A645C711_9ZZZZ